MKFLAYNGSYKLFGWIPAGDLGAHDADWEHVTMRLTPDGRRVLGVYYSAHRCAHSDFCLTQGLCCCCMTCQDSETGRLCPETPATH